MDKLKKVLSGQDGNDDLNILQEANEASTLGWGTRVKGFLACFVAGVLCSVLGTCLLWVPRNGLTLFAVFYSLGNIASLLSKIKSLLGVDCFQHNVLNGSIKATQEDVRQDESSGNWHYDYMPGANLLCCFLGIAYPTFLLQGMQLLSCSPRASSEMPLHLALAVSLYAALAPASVLPSMPLMYSLCSLAQTPHHTTGSPYSPQRMDTLHLCEQAHTDKYSLSLPHTHTQLCFTFK
ncbi:hypothetical protein cypCar_00016664 [Cyprinus carpio]|nr:hypothetical protein cypCar_00016664 [Cyprinus carpio]